MKFMHARVDILVESTFSTLRFVRLGAISEFCRALPTLQWLDMFLPERESPLSLRQVFRSQRLCRRNQHLHRLLEYFPDLRTLYPLLSPVDVINLWLVIRYFVFLYLMTCHMGGPNVNPRPMSTKSERNSVTKTSISCKLLSYMAKREKLSQTSQKAETTNPPIRNGALRGFPLQIISSPSLRSMYASDKVNCTMEDLGLS